MNKGTLRTIMYIALGVLIFSVVINLFFSILPYLLIGGAVIYVVTKVVGYFNSKKSKNSSNESTNNNYEVYVDDSVDTSNAIDVDFEDTKLMVVKDYMDYLHMRYGDREFTRDVPPNQRFNSHIIDFKVI